MKKLISQRAAALGLLSILGAVVVFHLLVITGVIPFKIVWGGRLRDHSQMLSFEAVSIGLNLLMLAVVATKAGLVKARISPGIINAALWMMFGLFLMNTIGNIFSNNEFEKMVFTPLTLLLSLLSLRLAAGKDRAVAAREML